MLLKIPAFWTAQIWCYFLELDVFADALVAIAQMQNPPYQSPNGIVSTSTGKVFVYTITKQKLCINYGTGKNPERINMDEEFVDKIYVSGEEGSFLKLETFETWVNHQFVVKSMT